jgi:ubiquinone/menaquinone biosynthesis C-methylase UbiE
MSFLQPHYVKDYRRLLRKMLHRDRNYDAVMSNIVGGGDYEFMGTRQRDFLLSIGLESSDYLIDVGCGSGRLSFALRDMPSLRYLGTDLLPELIEYAVAKCERRDWQFHVVEGLAIPEQNNQADMIAFFSVFTHLRPRESFNYLCDAERVVKPGGRIVVSYLDRAISHHRSVAGHWVSQLVRRLRGFGTRNILLDRGDLDGWGRHLGLECDFHSPEAVGQSVCVYRKPLHRR